MTTSKQAHSKNISPSLALNISKWLQQYDFRCNRQAENIERCEYGENILEELSLSDECANGYLCCGLPAHAFTVSDANDLLFWLPGKWPRGKSVCVASSRLSQKLDTYDSWFDAIRTLAVLMDPAQNFFITGSGTTTDVFIKRIGQLFGISVVEFKPFPNSVSHRWFKHSINQANQGDSSRDRHPIAYFTAIEATQENKSGAKQKNESIDNLLIQVAAEVRLLSVRKNGNIIKATRQRLNKKPFGTTKLLIDARLTANTVKQELMTCGATAWWLYHDEPVKPQIDRVETGSIQHQKNAPKYDAPILDISEIKSDHYLLHWTRRRVGPWPDQTSQEYLDDLIFRANRRNHGEVASVARILASRRILGTNQLTRSSQPVACFTNVPLNEIKDRKVFRSHLGRWDCLPFGIAIDRERLQELGARPVVYGDEATWEEMDESQKAFFQLATTSNKEIDWREEEEWRLVGDLDLKLIDTNSAVVFVENSSQAYQVSALSRWPIVVIDAD